VGYTPVAKSLEDLIGYVSLTGLIQAQLQLPDVLPPAFDSFKQEVLGDAGRYTQVKVSRRTLPLSQYGAPAGRENLQEIALRDIKLHHTFRELHIDPLTFQKLRNFTDYNVQNMGMQEVTRQVYNFRLKAENTRRTIKFQTLTKGKVYVDGNGNILPSASGAQSTYDFGMSANNQGQGNGIIAEPWDSQTADIPLHIRNLKQQAVQRTGYPLRYAIYGKNIPSYLTVNAFVQDYLSRSPNRNEEWLASAELPSGLFGLTWVPGYEQFYEDATGTNRTILGDDEVVFCPEPSSEWWERIEGSYAVPTSLNIFNDASAYDNFKQVYGMFGYSHLNHNPPGASMFVGDTFAYVLKVPDAVYQLEVVF
jgi:hypothetical protein